MPLNELPPGIKSNAPMTQFRRHLQEQESASKAMPVAKQSTSALRDVASRRIAATPRATLRMDQAVRQGAPETTEGDMRKFDEQYRARYDNAMASPHKQIDNFIDDPATIAMFQKRLDEYIPGIKSEALAQKALGGMESELTARTAQTKIGGPKDGPGRDPNYIQNDKILPWLTAFRDQTKNVLTNIRGQNPPPVTDTNDPAYQAWMQGQFSQGGFDPMNGNMPDTSLDAYNKGRVNTYKPIPMLGGPGYDPATGAPTGATPDINAKRVAPQLAAANPPAQKQTGNSASASFTGVKPIADAVQPVPEVQQVQPALSGLPQPATSQTALSNVTAYRAPKYNDGGVNPSDSY